MLLDAEARLLEQIRSGDAEGGVLRCQPSFFRGFALTLQRPRQYRTAFSICSRTFPLTEPAGAEGKRLASKERI
jgi:hypothetical protein